MDRHPEPIKPNNESQQFLFEKISTKLGLPGNPAIYIVILYFLFWFIPALIEFYYYLIRFPWVQIWFMRFYGGWLLFIVYGLWVASLYKKKFFTLLKRYRPGISELTYNRAKKSFTDIVPRIVFLILIWLALTIAYYPFTGLWFRQGSVAIALRIASLYLVICPVGADIFSALWAGAKLPSILAKELEIKPPILIVSDPDRCGGLKPIADLLITETSLFFIGVGLFSVIYIDVYLYSFIYYYRTLLFGMLFPFILFGLLLFFAPQIPAHNLLASSKEKVFDYVRPKYRKYHKMVMSITEETIKEHVDDLKSYREYLSALGSIRDDAKQMRTWLLDTSIVLRLVSLSSMLALLDILLKILFPT